MSDFLSNLLRRHERSKPIVRPRMPSLFESETRRESPVTELTVEAEAPATASALPQQDAMHPIAPAPQASAAATPPHGARLEPVAQAGPFVEAPKPNAVFEVHVEHDAAAFAPPMREAERASAPKSAQDRIAAAPTIVERHTEHHTLETERRIERETVLSSHYTIEKTQVESPAPAIVPAPRSSNIEMKPASPPFAPPREERPVGREVRRREAREMPVPAAPETTIQISIGRIEIKATEERERSARKAEKPSSVMTLDDYLKSRVKR